LTKKERKVKDNTERWLLTYADLMNLLLILFIVLYTMSQIDIDKYRQVASSLRMAFGESSLEQLIGEGGSSPSVIDLEGENSSAITEALLETQQMENIKAEIESLISQQGLSGQVDVSLQERGIVISIGERVLFDSGSAEIDKDYVVIIEKIGKVLLSIPGKQIRVEGHTDTDPIKNSKFPDNQELSTARANSVLRILANNVGIDHRLLSAAGYGEWRPVAPNDTEENKAKNRRVDIVILRDKYGAT